MGRAAIPMVGRIFGDVTVIDFSHRDNYGALHFRCKCSCGNLFVGRGISLRAGYLTCCVKCRYKNPGVTETKSYQLWINIKERCFNPRYKQFKDYGGRDITMDPNWIDDFAQFYKDMGDVPFGLQIDRIDNNKGYYKENLRWATPQENCKNRRPRPKGLKYNTKKKREAAALLASITQ